MLGAVGFPQPHPCHGLWPQSQACAPDPAGTRPRSCDGVGRPPGGLTWVALVAASLAVGAVVTAGAEALHTAHLALPALPRALGLPQAGLVLTWLPCVCQLVWECQSCRLPLKVPTVRSVGVPSRRAHSFRS